MPKSSRNPSSVGRLNKNILQIQIASTVNRFMLAWGLATWFARMHSTFKMVIENGLPRSFEVEFEMCKQVKFVMGSFCVKSSDGLNPTISDFFMKLCIHQIQNLCSHLTIVVNTTRYYFEIFNRKMVFTAYVSIFTSQE